MTQLRPNAGPMRVLRLLAGEHKPLEEWLIGGLVFYRGSAYGAIGRLVRCGYAESVSIADGYKHWQITQAGRDYLASVDGDS